MISVQISLSLPWSKLPRRMQFLTAKNLYRLCRAQPGLRLLSPSRPVYLFHFHDVLLRAAKVSYDTPLSLARRPITEHISALLSSLFLGSFIHFAIINPDLIAKTEGYDWEWPVNCRFCRTQLVVIMTLTQKCAATPIHQFLPHQLNYEQ